MALSLRTGRPLGPIVSPDDAAAALAELDPVQAAEFFEKFPGHADRDDRRPRRRRAGRAGELARVPTS